MRSERRRHRRLAWRTECWWEGSANGRPSRITDLSLGGCFIETLAAPAIGQQTTIALRLEDEGEVVLAGRVVSIEPAMGFSVQFTDLEPAARDLLTRFLHRRLPG